MGWIEEVAPIDLFLWFALPLAVLLLMSARRRRKLPFPPGPPKLPIIGNMLMGPPTHRDLAKLAERYGGLLHLRNGFLHIFVVSTPEMAREVLQVQDVAFSNRPATVAIAYLTYDRADMAFAHYGPYWRQMRKLCVMKLFSRKHAESWVSVREEVDVIVSAVAKRDSGDSANLGELLFKLTMSIVYRAAFGSRGNDDQEEFIAIVQEFSKLFAAFNIGDFFPWLGWMDPQGVNRRLKTARTALDRFIDKIIDEHMANPKDADAKDRDMVDEMLEFLEDGSGDRSQLGGGDDVQGSFTVTRNNIKAIIMDVMFGGTETVASAIEWAMAELVKSPDDMRRVQEELAAVVGLDRKVNESDLEKLPFLKCVIKETLRLHPPIPLLQHETAVDCEVSGYLVPARSQVMINVWAIGRNKAAWKDADEFRPTRFAPGGDAAELDFKGNYFEFVPFGSGRRSCPGMQLGLHALQLAVAQLAHCFTWALPDGMKPSELNMEDSIGLTAARAVRLVAVPTPRLTCSL
ncbi:hypothetical protein Cni_G00265 [Canna indica]|uniref:Cytochrome P450 84A1 n=1 Tax=Canna indica TaxID=4628 RepID=A0AAQ3JMH4_9LILI|nr:hypothetical protein Cni_G00265 [Canna indica]